MSSDNRRYVTNRIMYEYVHEYIRDCVTMYMYVVQAGKDHMLLKTTLSQVEAECHSARTQVSALQRKLLQLETELQV